MGLVCCVPIRDKNRTLPKATGGEILHRNVCSPSWNFRWDNRRRVAGEIEDSSYQVSHGVRANVNMEMKGAVNSDRGNLSDGGSSFGNFGTPASQKSPSHDFMSTNMMTPHSDVSVASDYCAEVKNLAESPEVADSSAPRLTFSIPSAFSTPTADPLPRHHHPLPPNSTPSRRPRRSPGHRLLRQVSDSRILGLKSPNNFSITEGRSSFVHSACSNALSTGSHGVFSDGWSVHAFSELVASSLTERWSFDSEFCGNISSSSSRFSYSPVNLQTCGACSKLLLERSPWSSQRIVAGNELSVVAVLDCGHVYHAECLETMTSEVDKYDPTCPICIIGEKEVSRIYRKALRAEAELVAKNHKISGNCETDSCIDDDEYDYRDCFKREGKAPMTEPSSSKKSLSAKPFLKRRFSFGSKWGRSLSENDSAKKKGFWARHRKD